MVKLLLKIFGQDLLIMEVRALGIGWMALRQEQSSEVAGQVVL